MPRKCTICEHPQREAIDKALVANDSFRNIAERFAISVAALTRHKARHLPGGLLKSEAVRQDVEARNVMAELERCFERVNLLFDACDRWLRDPDDPSRYDLGPRANELMVIYNITNEAGTSTRRKAPLQRLLNIVGERHTVLGWEAKSADPRELVLKTANRLQGHIELLAELKKELSRQPVVNILVTPEWLQLRATLVQALQSYPEARQSVLLALEAAADGD